MIVLLAEGDDDRAEEDENRHERLDVDRNQQRRDRRTDFGAEQHTDRLPQLHQTRVGKADDHRVGRGGALDDSGDKRTDQHCEKLVARDFLQQRSQLVTCGKLESFTHVFHTDEEQAQSAERHDDLQNDTVSVHNYTSH